MPDLFAEALFDKRQHRGGFVEYFRDCDFGALELGVCFYELPENVLIALNPEAHSLGQICLKGRDVCSIRHVTKQMLVAAVEFCADQRS